MANFTYDSINITKDLPSSDVTLASSPIRMQPDNIRGYLLVNYIVLCNIIAVFGIASNIINATVFFKQGFTEAITVSLFALSLSDLCQLVMVFLVSNFHIPMLVLRSNFTDFLQKLTFFACGVLRICFSRISIWITVFITLERCVCIISPLKVRTLFTPKRMSLVIAIIFGLILLTSIPVFATVKVVTSIEPKTNQTLYMLVVMKLGSSMQDFSVVATIFIQILSLAIITINNVLLLFALKKRKQRWTQKRNGVFVTRETVSSQIDDSPVERNSAGPSGRITISALNITIAQSLNTSVEREQGAGPSGVSPTFVRDRKLSRMVIILAVILVVSFLPSSVWFCLTRIRPEFQPHGRHRALTGVVWSFMYVLEALNSAINILVYFYMSTRYRDTLRRMFVKLRGRRQFRVAPAHPITLTSRLHG